MGCHQRKQKDNYIKPETILYKLHVECPLLDSSQDDHADSKPNPFGYDYEIDDFSHTWGDTWGDGND